MWNKKLTLFLLLIIGTFFISGCSFFRPKPHQLYKRAMKEQPYDVIIVPGCPYNGKNWSTAMKGRVLWATYLLDNGLARNVIFSGGAVYSPYIEAKVMALYAESLGVPREKILTEEKAQHSTENIYYSYLLAKEKGFEKIAVASDPFQSKLLMGFTKRRFKTKITHIPFLISTLAEIDDVFPSINADSALQPDFIPITESQSKWQRFKGTCGWNIDFKKE